MQDGDIEALKAIHRESDFDYLFPALSDPLFLIKKVVEDKGLVVQGIAAKVELTVYLWVSHSDGTAEQRWEWMQQLVEATKLAAWQKGVDTLTCVVPPEIADSFERRLCGPEVGMSRDRPWPRFSYDLLQYVPRVESEVQAT